MLPAVPPLMPKVSVALLLALLAEKVPLVAVNVSNAIVSISIGPVTAVSVGGVGGVGGGRTIKVSGTMKIVDCIGGSEFCAWVASV